MNDRRRSNCALCGERVDLRDEHYRTVTAQRAPVHVECYKKLRKMSEPPPQEESGRERRHSSSLEGVTKSAARPL